MAEVGAGLQSTNADLVKCIEQVREKRDEVARQIQREEEEKARIMNELRILNERLSRLDEGLALKYAARSEYDKAITETENAFSKILESSKTLLHVLKRESGNLSRRDPLS
eukprot:358900_1